MNMVGYPMNGSTFGPGNDLDGFGAMTWAWCEEQSGGFQYKFGKM
jgi:hypothetical protein